MVYDLAVHLLHFGCTCDVNLEKIYSSPTLFSCSSDLPRAKHKTYVEIGTYENKHIWEAIKFYLKNISKIFLNGIWK